MKGLFFAAIIISAITVFSFASSVTVSKTVFQTKSGDLIFLYCENVSGPSSSTPSTNTAQTLSSSTGSYQVNNGSSAYLWSPQFSGATNINAGNWVFDLWASSLTSSKGSFGDTNIEAANESLGSTVIIPTGVIAYVPINLTNSQSTAVLGGTQVNISVNWNNYMTPGGGGSYLDNPVDNFVFFNSSGSLLYSWLENGASNKGNANVWVKLDNNGIPANGNYTIYLGFYSLGTVSLGWNNYTGVSAQLAGTYRVQYGKYDNGNLTFSFYDNFNGTTLNPIWTVSTSGSPITTVSNSLNVTASSETCIYAAISPSSTGMVMEVLWKPVAGTYAKFGMGNSLTSSSAFNSITGYILRPNWNGNTAWLQRFTGYNTLATITEPSNYTLGNVYEMQIVWSTASANNIMANDTTTGAGAAATDAVLPPSSGTQLALDATTQDVFYFVLQRICPPNGIMPTASLGSTQTAPQKEYVRGYKFLFTGGNNQVANNISVALYTPSTSSNVNYTCALYNGNATPFQLIATTQSNVVTLTTTASWYNFTFASPPSLTNNTNYVLVITCNASNNNQKIVVAASGGTEYNDTFATPISFPSSWSPSNAGSSQGSIYCTYSPSLSLATANVSIYVTNSTGSVTSTVASNVQISGINGSENQFVKYFTGTQQSIPANGYISVVTTVPASNPYNLTIYWGKGQGTDFQVPYRVLS